MKKVRLSLDAMIALLEEAPDAMVCVDSSGRIVLVNGQAERLFGYQRDDLAGQPVEILVPDANKARHRELRARYAAVPLPPSIASGRKLSGRRSDGTTFPAEISLSAINTHEGLVISAVVRDATEREQAARSQALLAWIIGSSHDAVISENLDGLVMTWNPGAERLYGYSAAEMIGHNINEIIPAGHRARDKEVVDAIVRGERMEQYPTERIRKDGTTITVSITMSPIIEKTGTITGVSRVTRDLTTQQRADIRFRGLLEAAPDAMVCVDPGGRIVLVNGQAERLFGYQRDDLAGQPVEILMPDAARARHPALRAGYAADPQPRPMASGLELSGRRRDGTTFPAEISLSAIVADDGTVITAAVRDITAQRRAREELERVNRNLESFAYSMAHDLRTPLRALAGFSAALMEEYADGLGETGRGYAERIMAASERMGDIIDDLLELSSVSRAQISLMRVDLGAEAASIAEEFQRQDPGRRVRFTIQQPVWARADRTLVRAVLQNLLENAWKFTSGRDDASIDFGTAASGDGQVCCYVRDNGAGYDPAYADKLFKPFQRLHTDCEFPGTGIGLASVRQIVLRHGGCIWAEGAVGKGATFWFTLLAT